MLSEVPLSCRYKVSSKYFLHFGAYFGFKVTVCYSATARINKS